MSQKPLWRVPRRQPAKSLFAVLLLAANCLGAAPASNNQDFTLDAWGTEEGLPQSSVKSIVQAPDGYLWMATFNGLARFDGVRFTAFDTGDLPALPDNRLVQLCLDGHGDLWVVTEYHGVARLHAGTARSFSAADGVPAAGALWVGADGQGGLWLAGLSAGLWRWENDRFRSVPLPPAFAEGPLSAMITDRAGRPWFCHRNRLLDFANGRFTAVPGPNGQPDTGVKHVCSSRAGGLWVVTSAGLRQWNEGNWRPDVWPCPDFKSAIVDAREDLAGDLWLATFYNGLFRFHPAKGWTHLTVESGLTTASLRSLLLDREGNLWVGTDGGGLLRIKPRSWKMITRREGLGIDAVHSVCQDPQGRIWFGGGTTKPYWLDQGRVSVAIPSPQSDVLGGVWAVLPAREGAMWIGTYGGQVFRYRDGVLTRYGKPEGMLAGSVRALLEDRQGRIWVGGLAGLDRIAAGQVTHFGQREGMSDERVWALAEDAAGNLYVGTRSGGLNRFRDGRFTVFTQRDGLLDDQVRALYVDAEDGLWIGSRSGGLSRFKAGRFASLTAKGGLPVRSVGALMEDDLGGLWMACDLGILRVSRRELDEFATGTRPSVSYVTYGRSDGLATTEVGGVQPACLKARDGRLWFGTTKGAAFLDPEVLRVNPLPPPVIIEEVRIDDEVVQEQRVEGRGRRAEGMPSSLVPRPAAPSPAPGGVSVHRLESHGGGQDSVPVSHGGV